MEAQAQAQAKPVKVTFRGRSTGMGAYTIYRIFSLRKKTEIKPHRRESSRTGNHWTDIWFLLPGKYFIYWQDISNTGKHYCGYGCLIVDVQGYKIAEWAGDVPEFARNALCECILPREVSE